MHRRAFVTGLGAVLVAPLIAEAQQAAKVSRVGYLGTKPIVVPIIEAFYAGLREQGYVIGRDVLVEERYADGTPERIGGPPG